MVTFPAHKFVEDLKALGVREHGVLLVHSSLRAMGKIEGGAETVIQGLLEVLGAGGTLLMPALSYETVGPTNPTFDICRTPSCVGALPEYFRRRQGTRRSIHPTHSVCGVGRQARQLLDGHENDVTPCGPHSPFHRLPSENGQILFLGCGLHANTSMHAIEERIEPVYLYGEFVDFEITHADGRKTKMPVRCHNFVGWVQCYDRLAQVLGEDALHTGKVLDTDCYLIESAPMWPAAIETLKQNPLYFVDREQ